MANVVFTITLFFILYTKNIDMLNCYATIIDKLTDGDLKQSWQDIHRI